MEKDKPIKPTEEAEKQLTKETEQLKKPDIPLTEEQKKQLEQANVYYGMVKAGQLFMSYVMKDLKKGEVLEMDSKKRKRIKKELKRGIISDELVKWYGHKIDGILAWIKWKQKQDRELNIKKAEELNKEKKND